MALRISCPSGGFFHHPTDLWGSARVAVRYSITSPPKALLSWLLSLAEPPTVGRVRVVQHPFGSRVMEEACSWDPFFFCYCSFPHIWASAQITIQSLSCTGSSFLLLGLAPALICIVSWETLVCTDRCVSFQIRSNHCQTKLNHFKARRLSALSLCL